MTDDIKTDSGSLVAELDIIVWVDLEMTGLNPDHDQIIEFAMLLTNKELEIIARGPRLVIHQPLTTLTEMDGWNRRQHRRSGLWDEVLISKNTINDAEQQSLKFLRHNYPGDKKLTLAGNSIWQDRRFIIKYMPRFNELLHHRMIDVSTIKQLSFMWYPEQGSFSKKESCHRALADIEESIDELRFYRQCLFKKDHGSTLKPKMIR